MKKRLLALLEMDREDVLFLIGLATVSYGVSLLSTAWSFIVAGALLILHSYIPGVVELIQLQGGRAFAPRGRAK